MADTLIAGATDATTAVTNADATKVTAPVAPVVAATDGVVKAAGTEAGAPDPAKVAADAAAAEAAKGKTGAPEKYEAFKLPEGAKLDDATVADLQATAKDLGLSQDQAQKLVDRELKVRADVGAAAQTEFKATVAKWADDAKADKDIGGDKLPTTLASAKKGVDAMESQVPGLKQILDATGFGNHPVAIKLFQKIGGMISEDGKFIQGGAKPADKNSEAAVASRMYPTMKTA